MSLSLTFGITTYLGERYRIARVLGRGGMASVYEAVDEATGRRVAVKRLHPHRATGDGQMARLFEMEFHTLSQSFDKNPPLFILPAPAAIYLRRRPPRYEHFRGLASGLGSQAVSSEAVSPDFSTADFSLTCS